MKTTVSVSVVTPCYRCTRTLARAVASIAAQTCLPTEVILVDDGSCDETRTLMIQLQSKYEPGWVKLVLLNTNAGAASARNAGWDQALGKYVAFLDADDAWHPSKIELQFKFMDAHPGVAVSGHGHRQVTTIPNTTAHIDSVCFSSVSLQYVFLKNPFVTPSFMVRRNLENRFLPGRRFMEDHFFLMQVSAAGLLIAKAHTPLAYIFKPIFGESGLSADLVRMQRAELENYSLMQRAGSLSLGFSLALKGYSWLKFCRRMVIVKGRQFIRRISTH
jgi:glycosyltransferase involved in cell wall biosynthesis